MKIIQRIKYPRTYHLPQSPGKTSDDKVLTDLSHLIGHEVVITEKMDGENTTIYNDGYLHARSIDGNSHPSRNWIKSTIVPKLMFNMDNDLRICGENLYAKHSLEYNKLDSYFYMFSIWLNDTCLSWDFTEDYARYFDLTLVPVMYKGILSEKIIDTILKEIDLNVQEGFVIRRTCEIQIDQFSTHVAKYVRKNHVTTDQHWAHQEIIPNSLK